MGHASNWDFIIQNLQLYEYKHVLFSNMSRLVAPQKLDFLNSNTCFYSHGIWFTTICELSWANITPLSIQKEYFSINISIKYFECLLFYCQFGFEALSLRSIGCISKKIFKIKLFPWSMLVFGQKSCFFGTTIFEIPQPNWY